MNEPWIGLAVAVGVGLLVGVERERRKGSGPQREAAGMRSFTLITLAGALAQSLSPGALVVAGAVAVAALAALAYWRSVQVPEAADPGLTTELAMLVAYLVGVQCAVQPAVGAACGAVLAALLAARERMHRFATEWLTEQELHDALVLAGVALVVVPLAPTEPWRGLGGLAPRTAAWLVLLILSMQAAAHVARRLLGERHALMAAGLLSGFVSSTATIATFGAQAKDHDVATQRRLGGAASLSAAATWLQALALAAVASPTLLPQVLPLCAAGAGVATLAGLWSLRGSDGSAAMAPGGKTVRPLRLREALLVAVVLLVVSVAVSWLRARYGTHGLLAGTALAALADAHAPIAAAFNLHAQGLVAAPQALQSVLVAAGVNSTTRLAVAFATGGRGYGTRVGTALVASWAAAALALWGSSRFMTLGA